MKQKNITKRLALIIGTACLTLMTFVCPAASMPAQAATGTETTVQPRQHSIEYVYKIEDGKLYKRLYDYTIGVFIGDWIYVCDYPG